MLAVPVEDLPRVQVRLGDIDLDDRRFDVRFQHPPSTSPRRGRPPTSAMADIRRPVLWVPEAPYKILRGFRYLDRLVHRAKRSGKSCWGDHPVEVAFLSASRRDSSSVDAMLVACTGEPDASFRLTTREWARAVRTLRGLRVSQARISEFLETVAAPKRTADRARLLAQAPKSLWEAFEACRLTICDLEEMLRAYRPDDARPPETSTAAAFETADAHVASILGILDDGPHPHRTSDAGGRGESETTRAPRAPEPGSTSSDERFVTFTRRKRLIIYHQNVGPRTDPRKLRGLRRALIDAIMILSGWLPRRGSRRTRLSDRDR